MASAPYGEILDPADLIELNLSLYPYEVTEQVNKIFGKQWFVLYMCSIQVVSYADHGGRDVYRLLKERYTSFFNNTDRDNANDGNIVANTTLSMLRLGEDSLTCSGKRTKAGMFKNLTESMTVIFNKNVCILLTACNVKLNNLSSSKKNALGVGDRQPPRQR